MAEVQTAVFRSGKRLGRRGAMRMAAGGAVLVAGSAALAACGIPGAVTTNGVATIDVSTASVKKPTTMVSNHSGKVDLVARGADLGKSGAKTDDFGYYFAQAKTDGTYTCEVIDQGISGGTNATAGLVARESADPDAPEVAILATDGNGVVFRWRPTAGAPADQWPMQIAIGVQATKGQHIWLQLQKKGSAFTVAYSLDGKTYANQTSTNVTFSQPTYLIGLAACAASASQQALDQFGAITGFKPTAYLDVNPAMWKSQTKSSS